MNPFNPLLIAYITRLAAAKRNHTPLLECDYSKIMSLALPQHFTLQRGWNIAPEFVLTGNFKPDYLISQIDTNPGLHYGGSTHHVVVETKNHAEVSWGVLLKDQLWDQADAAQTNGTMWAIGLIGFHICFFHFDLNAYPSASGQFTNFNSLNLDHFTSEDLDLLEIDYITEVDASGNDVIRVIKWRIDIQQQHTYINCMFLHMVDNHH
jgi:hypothetical protein